MNTKKVLVHISLCFDNVDPDILQELFDNNPDKHNHIVNVILGSNYTDVKYSSSVLNGLLSVMKQRYVVGEKNGAINLIYSSGLRKFVSDRVTFETRDFGIEFEAKQITRQLMNIRERLNHSAAGKQSYYIIKSDSLLPDNSYDRFNYYVCFKGDSAFFASPKTMEYFSGVIIGDVAFSNDFYGYLSSLVERRNESDSKIMNDDEARTFIDSLIASLNESVVE
jgi:hypothetical protein